VLGVLAGKLYVDVLLRKSLCGENACRMDKRRWSKGFKAGKVLAKTNVEKLSTICLCEFFVLILLVDYHRGCVQIVSIA
jgi:hypothetical protein